MIALSFSVEVITIPVSDVDRALRFYKDQLGFHLDVDYSPNDAFRVVQLTPPGSACSIQIGKGLTDAPAGSLRNIYLVVTDLDATGNQLLARGAYPVARQSALPRSVPRWWFSCAICHQACILNESVAKALLGAKLVAVAGQAHGDAVRRTANSGNGYSLNISYFIQYSSIVVA